MITKEEKQALVEYLEFLLIKQLVEPIIVQHVNDKDVIILTYETVYEILNELEQTITNYRTDAFTTTPPKKKNKNG